MNPCRLFFHCRLMLCILIPGLLLLSGCSMTYDGEKIFFQEGCGKCHTFKGKGGMMGPDLSAVSNLRSDGWIDSYIQDPKKKYPFSRMPSFSHLEAGKRRAIISFLKQ